MATRKTTSDDDFDELIKQCREEAGEDNKYFLKLLTDKGVDHVAHLVVYGPYKVDQGRNLQDYIGDKIPSEKRGCNAEHKTKKPYERDTKTDAPSTSNFNVQLSRSGERGKLEDYLEETIYVPKKKRGTNKTKKPDEEDTKTDAPSASNFNVQLSQSVFNNSRKDVCDSDDDYVPADCMNKGKKPIDYERAKRDKGKQKVIESDDEDKEERNVKKKRSIPKKLDFKRVGLEPPPGLSEEVKNFIEQKGGTEVKLVLMKNLYRSDLDRRHDRLSIPVSQVRDETFLSKEEKDVLMRKGHHIGVNMVLSEGHQVIEITKMKLRYWNTNSQYALTSSWMGVVGRNKDMLTVNSIVQIWSFRSNGELWLILAKIRNAAVDYVVMVKSGSDGKVDDDQNDTKNNSTRFRLFGVNILS